MVTAGDKESSINTHTYTFKEKKSSTETYECLRCALLMKLSQAIRSLIPSRHPKKVFVTRVTSSKFTRYRRVRSSTDLGTVLNQVSYILAILCIFEASIWFASSFSKLGTTEVNIFCNYLNQQIHHKPASVHRLTNTLHFEVIRFLEYLQSELSKVNTELELDCIGNQDITSALSISTIDWIVLRLIFSGSSRKSTKKREKGI